MTAENNRKYIAEAWINNEDDEEFKKDFLNVLLKQYMGHGNEFDADTVDGYHYTDIMKEVRDITQFFITAFSIGRTDFTTDHDESIPYYLGFDGIKLYNFDAEETTDEEKKLPWSSTLYTNKDEIPNLLTVINQLYNHTFIGGNNSEKTAKQIYDEFHLYVIDATDSMDNRLKTLETGLKDNLMADGSLSADAVNGIRFFIYTQEQYDALKESASHYNKESDTFDFETEDTELCLKIKKDYELLNSVTNVFIIKTEEEIKNSGYKSGIYDFNPETLLIKNRYYSFKVLDNFPYEKNGKTINGKCVVYKHEDSSVWQLLCPAEDLIDEDTVKQFAVKYVLETLAEDSNYTLNPEAVIEALKHIYFSNSGYGLKGNPDRPLGPLTDIPWATYNQDTYVKKGFYTKGSGNTSTTTTLSADKKSDNFRYLNLTPLYNEIGTAISAHKSEEDQEHTEMSSDFDEKISAIRGNSESNFPSIDTEINSLKTQITDLQTQINEINTWERVQTWNDGSRDFGYLTVNKKLHLAHLVFSEVRMYRNSNTFYKGYYFNTERNTHAPIVPVYEHNRQYLPAHDLYSGTNIPNVTAGILGTSAGASAGQIMYRMHDLDVGTSQSKDRNNNKYYSFSFKFVYRYTPND